MEASGEETVRSILTVLAITKNLLVHGKFMFDYSEDELFEMKKRFDNFDS